MSTWDKTLVTLRAWTPELALGTLAFARALASPRRREPGREWWRRPGLGIMYQIEHRPGWDWDRDYDRFNRTMRGEGGRFAFNGPFCRVDEWVELSREVGVDFHIQEVKWHDGICFFDTALTDWKSDVDYAESFSRLSREAGIPFMFYYSSVFDHSPVFDDIQPNRHSTFSILGLGGQPAYEEYLRGQYRELVERYRPDGMWIDWYWPGDAATDTTIDFLAGSYPEVVLGFNMSNYFPASYGRMDYTIGEAHELDGPLVKLRRTGAMFTPVLCSTWKWSALGRLMMDHPWEAVGPAGRWWQDPQPREDPDDLLRMAAIVMASGGRFTVGATARMDGSIVPGQAEQLRLLGDWYRPRRELFSGALPALYRGPRPPGVRVRPRCVKAAAARLDGDTLLHLVNMHGATRPIKVALKGRSWSGVSGVFLEPEHEELPLVRSGSRAEITIPPERIDPVDTILRLS